MEESGGYEVGSPSPGGRWFIDFTDHAGKQIRSATSASTKKEAVRILRARMGEQARAEATGARPQASLQGP